MMHHTRFKGSMLKMILILTLSCMCTAGCDSKKTVKIGFTAGMSGRVADLGIAGLDAVQMMIEKENEEGGVNARSRRHG